MTKETTTSDKRQPRYTILLLPEDKDGYPTRVGVAFETRKGNCRMVWDVLPATHELARRELVLVPYQDRADYQQQPEV